MKKITGLLLTTSLIFLFQCCKKDNVTEPNSKSEPVNPDTVFTDIDTTLKIQIIQEGDLTIYTIDKYYTIVAKIPRISSYLYLERPAKSLQQIAGDSNYALVVNASYFDALFDDSTKYTGLHFKPAGFLKINDTVHANTKVDRQLTRLFAYSSKTNTANYFDTTELDKTRGYDLVVQTGPQIIKNSEIDTADINTSINGNTPWMRTAFASVNGNQFYVIVALGKAGGYGGVTLQDLGKMLRSSGIFKKELNIINFDGGLSTSLYIKNHPELCWFADGAMPLLICVK